MEYTTGGPNESVFANKTLLPNDNIYFPDTSALGDRPTEDTHSAVGFKIYYLYYKYIYLTSVYIMLMC